MSAACHAMPPPVPKSMQEIPRAPRVSNFPCPEIKCQRNIIIMTQNDRNLSLNKTNGKHLSSE